MTVLLALLTIVLGAVLGFVLVLLFQAKDEVEATQNEMVRVRQQAKADLARYQSIADLEAYKADLQGKLRYAQSLLPKFQSLVELEQHRAQLTSAVEDYSQASKEWQEHIAAQQTALEELKSQTASVEETLEMQSFGFYRPKYDFPDSSHYARELEQIRNQQKTIIKSDAATHCPQSWTVDGSETKGRKMVKEHAKLMLRAFNGECDAAIAKTKYNNIKNLETRINRSFEAINKLGESKQLWIERKYLTAKLQELYLVHEHREKVQEEREEQRRIREQMREEEKVRREIEAATRAAEQEETAKSKALEDAKRNLAGSHGEQTARLQAIVDRLEIELEEALERKARAIARAQLTRSGHVYVLSNIGSFGDGVYKIGMTRRLDPQDRVRELGDASVPFGFDVHAMIYSKDAPTLENTLHRHFAARRVNLANPRREYFRVTLDEIRVAVEQHFGAITFVNVPEAEEFYRTHALREELERPGSGAAWIPEAIEEPV